MVHSRKDLTKIPVLFFPMYSYLVVYEPEANPIRIMAVLRGKRNVKRIIKIALEREEAFAFGVGVSEVGTYKVKKLDRDYFEE